MRNIFIASLLFFACHMAQAQAYASSVELTGGYVEDGFGGYINYNHHLDRRSHLQFGVFVGISNDSSTGEEIPYNIFTFNPGYFRKLISTNSRKPITLNIGGGGIIGYEVINNGSNELPSGAILNAKSQLIYGAFAGLEVEYAMKENLSLNLKAVEQYHPNSDIGEFYPFVGIGLRYYLF